MNIIMQDQTVTNLSWWEKMRIVKATVVLEVEGGFSLAVARCRSKAKAEALFKDINEGIRLKRKVLSVADWNRDYVPSPKQEAAGLDGH